MNGPGCRSRDERTTAMIVNEKRRAVENFGGEVPVTSRWVSLNKHNGAAARESAGRRGTGDIEPNASNKANIMALMTGCVPLTLVTRSRLRLLRTFSSSLRETQKSTDAE